MRVYILIERFDNVYNRIYNCSLPFNVTYKKIMLNTAVYN